MRLCFIKRAKSWRYRVHVCVSFTQHSVAFLLVFYPARVSACSGVIGLVCVPSCKDEGVWLVLTIILARPKWHDVNAFQIGLQNSTPVIVVTQKMMHSQGIKWSVCQGLVVDWPPANLQKIPKGGVVSTPLPIKHLTIAFSCGKLIQYYAGRTISM